MDLNTSPNAPASSGGPATTPIAEEWQGRSFADLRDFLAAVEERGELKRISGAHWDGEIGAITEAAAARRPPKALLFEDIPDYPGYRVATNLMNENAPARERLLHNVPLGLSHSEALLYWKAQLSKRKSIPPIEVADGPVSEVVVEGGDVDLTTLPWVRWHANDGGRYMCATAAMTRDPDTGFVNVGSYRFMLVDGETLVGHLASGHHGDVIQRKYWARGGACPISIALGFDPTLLIAAAENLPWGEPELGYAGWLRGAPIEVVKGVFTGLPVPATAEAVIEAEILPPEKGGAVEGPFGEATGYYGGGAKESALMKARAIMRRTDPIVMGSPPLFGTGRSVFGDKALLIWEELERLGIPGICGVSKHWGMTIISLRQAYPGHSKRAAMGALGGIAGYYAKYIVLVDEDIDPANMDEVIWAIATRSQPEESIDVVREIWTNRIDPRLDPAKKERGDLTGSVAIIDATRPFHWRDEFPKTTAVDPEVRRITEQKWGAVLDG